MSIDKYDAEIIKSSLISHPVAPGIYSHFINVGTNKIIDSLEEHYFKREMAKGISCFKYLQGYYGSGKTQFINSLAARAWQNNIVTSIVNVGKDCPFNSRLAIYQAVVSNMIPPPEPGKEPSEERGIEVLFRDYVDQQLKRHGIEGGQSVPSEIRSLIERPFTEMLFGVDTQTVLALQQLGNLMLNMICGGSVTPAEMEIISWLRGDNVTSRHLKEKGLHKPVKDESAFNRLKTIIHFMTKRMGVKGFFIAFDEGTRTVSFRRGSVKQKDAIENLLTMINDGADRQFPGVMFLYAATPDFRNEVIRKYPALNDRIGEAFRHGSPMVPFIDLDALDTDDIVRQMGVRLLEVFGIAEGIKWNNDFQTQNIEYLLDAEKSTYGIGSEIRRAFVYHFCILLDSQKARQRAYEREEILNFIQNYEMPNSSSEADAS